MGNGAVVIVLVNVLHIENTSGAPKVNLTAGWKWKQCPMWTSHGGAPISLTNVIPNIEILTLNENKNK